MRPACGRGALRRQEEPAAGTQTTSGFAPSVLGTSRSILRSSTLPSARGRLAKAMMLCASSSTTPLTIWAAGSTLPTMLALVLVARTVVAICIGGGPVMPAAAGTQSSHSSSGCVEQPLGRLDQDLAPIRLVGSPLGKEVQQLAGVPLPVRQVRPVRASEQAIWPRRDESAAERRDNGQRLVWRDSFTKWVTTDRQSAGLHVKRPFAACS